jgi:hypothetical protein
MYPDGVIWLRGKKLHGYLSKTSHDIALESQSPLCLKGLLRLFVFEQGSEVVSELTVKGVALLRGGKEKKKVDFGVVHLAVHYFSQ